MRVMQQIELSAEERDVLGEILQRAMIDLESEIIHTDTHSFKELLRHRHEIMEQLQNKLTPLTVAA
jgi:hypothetical protein